MILYRKKSGLNNFLNVLKKIAALTFVYFFVPCKQGQKKEKTVNSNEVTTVDVVVFWLSST